MGLKIRLIYVICFLSVCIILFLGLKFKTNSKELQIKPKKYFNNNFLTDDFIDDDNWWDSVKNDYIDFLGEDYLNKLKKNGIASKNADKIRSLFKTNNEDEVIFPNYIGGIYINKDNDLILQIVDKYKPSLSSNDFSIFNEITKIDENIKFEEVEFSDMELREINNFLVDKFRDYNLYTRIGISEIYIDTVLNRIVVNLLNFNDEFVQIFKNEVMNSDAIVFQKGYEIETTLNSGGAVGSCSVGYRARKNTSGKGFVTAGHCYCNNASVSGFGIVNNRQFGGKIDAAWINSASVPLTIYNTLHDWSITGSLPLPSPSSVTTTVATPTTGQYIGRVGKSSGHRLGSIVSTTSTFYSSVGDDCESLTPYMTNQITTTVYQYFGDSGGIVYLSSDRSTLGIGTFRNSSNSYMIFSSAKNINSTFGVSRY